MTHSPWSSQGRTGGSLQIKSEALSVQPVIFHLIFKIGTMIASRRCKAFGVWFGIPTSSSLWRPVRHKTPIIIASRRTKDLGIWLVSCTCSLAIIPYGGLATVKPNAAWGRSIYRGEFPSVETPWLPPKNQMGFVLSQLVSPTYSLAILPMLTYEIKQ